MEEIKMSKEKLFKIKEIIIFILLFLWMVMPIIQTIKPLYKIISIKDCYFLLMKIIAVVGITFSTIYIIYSIRKASDKKETLKEILPIILLIIYMGWTLISCLKSPNSYFAFNGNSYRREGYYMYINYAGYFLCAFLLKNKKLRKVLLNTFLISSVFLIIISRICLDGQRFTDFFVNTEIDTTVFAQFNHYGYYIMMSLVCCLGLFITEKNKILKIVYLILYTIIGYAMIYNDTFGCYLATVAILTIYGLYSVIKKKDRKLIFIAIAIFTLLSCTVVKDNENIAYKNVSNFASDIKTIICKVMNIEIEGEDIDKEFEKAGTSRMKLWTNGIKFVLERPIIGYGPDNLRFKYWEVSINQDRPHNLIIYLSAVSGIPGMLLYVTAVGIIIARGIKQMMKKNKNNAIYLIVIITYLISSMFGNSMPYTSPYFFIFLGSLMQLNLQEQDEYI